jgi:hypothetical protein
LSKLRIITLNEPEKVWSTTGVAVAANKQHRDIDGSIAAELAISAVLSASMSLSFVVVIVATTLTMAALKVALEEASISLFNCCFCTLFDGASSRCRDGGKRGSRPVMRRTVDALDVVVASDAAAALKGQRRG